MFYWYHNNNDGSATVYEDSAAIRARVDSEPHCWYGNAEGVILNGGVQATAFVRKIEMTYDAAYWLRTKELRHMGERTTTTITAQPKK